MTSAFGGSVKRLDIYAHRNTPRELQVIMLSTQGEEGQACWLGEGSPVQPISQEIRLGFKSSILQREKLR